MEKTKKQSKVVKLGILGTVAAACVALVGCNEKPAESWDQTCVDKNGVVAEKAKCVEEQKKKESNSGHIPFYMWYYTMGSSGTPTAYPIGSRISGGTYVRPVSFAHPTSSTVTRGGFGSLGIGHSVSS